MRDLAKSHESAMGGFSAHEILNLSPLCGIMGSTSQDPRRSSPPDWSPARNARQLGHPATVVTSSHPMLRVAA
jgi:hypothetical protein